LTFVPFGITPGAGKGLLTLWGLGFFGAGKARGTAAAGTSTGRDANERKNGIEIEKWVRW